ncbi:hypothetical protein OROHE_007074 [Orobanche hederae]
MKKRVARILVFKICPQNGSVWYFSSKLDIPSNVLQKKRVAHILVFKIRPSQDILKIRDDPFGGGRNFDIQKKALEMDRSSQEIHKIRDVKKRVARILVFKIWPSQEILKIRDDIPSNVLQKKRVAHILVFKIRPSQDILKIRDDPFGGGRNFDIQKKALEMDRSSQEIHKIRDDVPSKVLQKKRVVRILVFKIRSSQEIHKIRDGTPLEVEEILTYIKKPRNGSFGTFLASYMSLVMYYRRKEWHGIWFSKLDHLKKFSKFKKRVARILVFKIRPYQEILKIRDVLQKKRVVRILVFKIRSSQEIHKIRDERKECNVLQKKRVAHILVFKIRPSQDILKIRDDPFGGGRNFDIQKKALEMDRSSQEIHKIHVPSKVLQKKRVVRILVFKIRSSQEIHKIRDGTPLEVEEILTYIKKPRNGSFGTFLASYMSLVMYYRRKEWHGIWFSKLDHLKKFSKFKKRVARILVFKIRPYQEILKIRDGTIHLEKKRVARILFFKICKLDVPSKVLQKKRVARILVFKIRPSQDILKIRDGTPLEAEEILTYRKSPQNGSVWYFSSKLDIPSNVLQKKRVAHILVFKIRPSQDILKIRDGTPLEAEEILTYRKKPSKWIGHLKKFTKFVMMSSQEIHKIRDGTPLEVEEILTYIKKPRNGSFGTFLASYMSLVMYYRRKEWHGFWFSKLDHLKKFSKFVMIPIWRPSQDILKIRDGTPLENKRVARILVFKIRPSQEILKIRDGTTLEMPYQEILKIRDGTTPLENKRVARILVFKIRPSQEILKIRDEWHGFWFSKFGHLKKFSKFVMVPFGDIPSNVLQKKRVAHILVFKIRPSQDILKIRDDPFGGGRNFDIQKKALEMDRPSQEIHKIRDDVPSKVLQKKRVVRILVFKIRSSQEIHKIRDGTPLEKKRVARILFFKIWPSQEILKIRDDVPSKVLQKKRVVRILVFKIRSSQEIHKIRDGTPLEVEEILTYIKKPRNGSFGTFLASYMSLVMYYRRKEWHGIWFSKLDHLKKFSKFKKRVARILVFKIRPYQEILKIRDDVPSNVLQKKRVARILFFKIWPSQEILKIRDGTPLEAKEILTYRKSPRNGSVWYFSSKLDVHSTVLHKKRVARILVFKIRPSQEILKIRDDVPSNVLQKKTVARILFFKIWPSQKILKIRDGTPLEAEEILTYRKSPQNGSVWYFSSMLDIPSNVLQKKRVEHILVFKIRPSQEILKIRDGTPLEKKTVARILFFKIWPSQKILKIRDGTPLEAEEILTYRKSPQNGSVWYFSSMLDIPSNVLQKKRVEHILVFKIRPSQDILKIRDGTPLEAEEILTYRKKPSKWIDVPSKVLQKKRVVRILVFKIRSSQEIHKIRDGTPLEVEEILTYIKKPRNGSFGTFLASYMSLVMYYRRKEWHGFWFSKLDHLKKFSKFVMIPIWRRVARILVFKIRPYQEILKIRDGTIHLEKRKEWHGFWFSKFGHLKKFSKFVMLDIPSNVLQKKRVAHILVFKIRPSQDILKIRDDPFGGGRNFDIQKKALEMDRDVPSKVLQKKRVVRILVFKIRSSQEIHKIRDGTPLEQVRYVPSKVLQKKRVVRILVFKIRSSQEIHKIRDGTPLEVEEILTYIKKPRNGSFGTFLASYMSLVMYYRRKEWHGIWFSKLDHLKKFSKFVMIPIWRVARILVFKIRPYQEILKIRDGTIHLEKKTVARILFFKIWPSQKILKIRDGTPLEAEEILTYRKSPQNGSVWYFSSMLDIPSNVLQKKRVEHILVFKIRPSQEILKIRDGTPLENVPSNVLQKKTVARILFFKIWPSQKILKIRDGTPLEAEEILTYRKSPQNGSVWYFSSMLDIPSNVLQKKRVEHILVFKIRPSQDILKIRDGTPLEAEEILTYRKKPSKWIVLQKKRVVRILVFKIRSSQEIHKIRDGTPLEVEEILTYIKKPRNGSFGTFLASYMSLVMYYRRKEWHGFWFSKLDHLKKFSKFVMVPLWRPYQEILKIRDVKKRVARILFFKIWPSQKILKIRDGTPLEAEEILTYRKSPQNGSVWYFSSKLDIPSNVLQKKRVAHILVFKIRPSQDILKIRDGTPLEAEEILTYRKKPSKWIVKRVVRILVFKIRSTQEIHKIRDGTPLEWHGFWFSKLDHLKKFSKFKKRVARILVFKIRPYQEILKIRDDVPSNVLQKKRVARILFFKIWPSQEILKIRDGTPLEAEEILTYRKSPQNGSVWYFSSKLDILSNVLQKKRVAHILVFKIRPSQDILKIRDGTPLEAEEILTYRKKPSKWIESSQEIHKIRDGTPLEVEEILTYIKKPRNGSFGTFLASYMSLVMYYRRKEWHGFWFSKLDHLKKFSKFRRVARILVFKIRPYQEILKIRDVKKRVARILVFKIRPSQDILKIRDGTPLENKRMSTQEIHKIRDDTPLEVEEILTYIKKPRNGSKEWHGFWFSKLDHLKKFSKFKKRVARILKKRVARILFFKIWPSQKILKIRDGTPLEAEEILTYRKSPQNGSVWYFSSKLDIPSNVLQKKRVAHILVFKIRPSQDILKIRDGTPLEAEEILTYRKKPSKWIESTQEIHKIRDDTPLEVEEILTYIKKPRNGSFGTFLASYMSLVMYYRRKEWHGFWFSKLDHLKKFSKFKRVARILKKRVARILFFKIWPSQKILKIRDGTPLEAEEILTYRKSPQNGSVWYFSSKLDIPSNVLQKKRVAHILVFKIRPSQDILKIRDGTPLEAEEILTYRKKPSKWIVLQKKRVVRILVFKIRSSQEIHKIRDGTPLEVEEILTYIKKPRNGSFGTFLASYMSLVMYYRRKEWHGFWFSKLDHLKKFSKFVMIPIWRREKF